jgi:hypothetical protein
MAYKKASIRRQFPGELLPKTLPEIEQAARAGDTHARRALKLLFQREYDK